MVANCFLNCGKRSEFELTGNMSSSALPENTDLSNPIGKRVGSDIYVHVSALGCVSLDLQKKTQAAMTITSLQADHDFDIVKFTNGSTNISLLKYSTFFEEAFPVLEISWRVDLEKKTFEKRSYSESLNPPILHRKELFLAPDHPDLPRFKALTERAESLGLFNNPTKIGFRAYWDQLIEGLGYEIDGHELKKKEGSTSKSDTNSPASEPIIFRHVTALTRYGYSAPVQSLARFGFLDGIRTVFDYGCGKGDDLRGLKENGISASGWDPFYAKDNPREPAHVVNLGFVINVIEDREERIDALKQAYGLATQLLVVSAMLGNQEVAPGTPYRDGVMTQRNTFQKYFAQGELKAFIEQALGEEAVPVAPGIFFVFRDKDEEQRFTIKRLRARSNILRAASIAERAPRAPRLSREDKLRERYEEHKGLLEPLWLKWLELGREPDKVEVPGILELIETFGSYPKALRFLQTFEDPSVIESAKKSKKDDLEVYFALRLFQKKKPYRHLEDTLQRDIRYFFGDYAKAQEAGKELLYQIAKPDAIEKACQQAAESGLGYLIPRESLQLHSSLVERLPPLLRVYAGCGTSVYGDVTSADLVKIHIKSAKLSLMRFENFEGVPLPKMIERVKINFREQDLQRFEYGEKYPPPYLYLKSRFINEEFPNFEEQVQFDEALESTKLLDSSEHGPPEKIFQDKLKSARREIQGFELIRSNNLPNLDDKCGANFTYRDFIECGETQARTKLPNLPRQIESYEALEALAINVLDPLIDYFGSIKLTYGFSSCELAKEISTNTNPQISPPLDQHAAHELNTKGNLICDRLGASCDFIVEDEDMGEVMNWIRENLPFDRMYFYGKKFPIHISYGPDKKGEAIEMWETSTGKVVPKKI